MDTGAGAEIIEGQVSLERRKRDRKWILSADVNTSNGVSEWIGRIARMVVLAAEWRKGMILSNPDLAGWLYKRDNAKLWKKRHFILQNGTMSFSLDRHGNEVLGVIQVAAITEMRRSSKTTSPKGCTAFKLVTGNRVWILASSRSQGTPQTWMEILQSQVPEAKIIDEKDYVHGKYGGHKMLPYELEFDIDDSPGTEVSQQEVTTMRTVSSRLNKRHVEHSEMLKERSGDMFAEAKTCSMFCLPCTAPAPEVTDAEASEESQEAPEVPVPLPPGVPLGSVLGWCSWCFGVPNGRCHEQEPRPSSKEEWAAVMEQRHGDGMMTWMVPTLKSPETPKDYADDEEDEGGAADAVSTAGTEVGPKTNDDIEAEIATIRAEIEADNYSRAGELAQLQAELKKQEEREKLQKQGQDAEDEAEMGILEIESKIATIRAEIGEDDHSRENELADLEAKLEKLEKHDDEKMDKSAGQLSTDLGGAPDDTSMEAAIDMIAALGKSLGDDDRPKQVKDQLKRLFFRCSNCTRLSVHCAKTVAIKDESTSVMDMIGMGTEKIKHCDAFAKVGSTGVDCYCFKHLLGMKYTKDHAPPSGFEGGMIDSALWRIRMYGIVRMGVPEDYEFSEDEQKEARKSGEPTWEWGRVPSAVKGKQGHCSWCGVETVHVLSLVRDKSLLDSAGSRTLMKCLGCRKQTQACAEEGCESFAYAGEKKCASHSKQSGKSLERYCSWCFEKSAHVPHNYDALATMSRMQYKCTNCDLRTYKCNWLGCKFAMAGGHTFGGDMFCAYHQDLTANEGRRSQVKNRYLYLSSHDALLFFSSPMITRQRSTTSIHA
jgi:hypothetical protein